MSSIQNAFFKEGVGLILDRFKPDQIESIMTDRIESHRRFRAVGTEPSLQLDSFRRHHSNTSQRGTGSHHCCHHQ